MKNRYGYTCIPESERIRSAKFRRIGERVYDFFDDTAIRNGFELREGQLDMACEIVDAIKEGQHLLVEAGVGIGKSFAYIVPALECIREYGGPVIIATSTIALQEQLKDDIDKVMKMLKFKVDVLIAKGQSHFLCRKRFDQFFTRELTNSSPKMNKLRNIINTGGKERADWKIQVPDEVWNRINVQTYNQKNCRDHCQYYSDCYYYNLRKKMLLSDGIIICNQDLLTADLSKAYMGQRTLLNPHKQLIIVDEAHNLESKVRTSLTTGYSAGMIRNLVERTVNAGLNDDMIPILADKINEAVPSMYNQLLQQMLKLDQKADREHMDHPERYYITVPAEASGFQKMIEKMRELVELGLASEADRKKEKQLEDLYDDLDNLCGHFDSFDRRKTGYDIFWAEKHFGDPDEIILYRCPKDVARHIAIKYLDTDATVILTSATLTSGSHPDFRKNYRYFAKNIGFTSDHCSIGEEKPSPFDYDRHTMLYYANDMPHPTREHDLFLEKGSERIRDLLQISNGKALILFTSKHDMMTVYDYLSSQSLPFDLLLHDGNVRQKETLDLFRSNTNSVLLGTGAFWEGINVEGMALSHLIVFRLPFPNPEPVIAYKVHQADDGLLDVLVPEMIIRLKQGIGRLIRSETDTGIVSVIDPRVSDTAKNTFKNMVWNSLPIKHRTSSMEVLKDFYESVCSHRESGKGRLAS